VNVSGHRTTVGALVFRFDRRNRRENPLVNRSIWRCGSPLELHLPAVNRHGRTVEMRVGCAPVPAAGDMGPTGAVLVMQEQSSA
jgi:hypothetical protein